MKKMIFAVLCLSALATLFMPATAAGYTYTEYYSDAINEQVVGVRATGTCYQVWGIVTPYKLTAVCR